MWFKLPLVLLIRKGVGDFKLETADESKRVEGWQAFLALSEFMRSRPIFEVSSKLSYGKLH